MKRMSTGSELTPARQEETPPPSETTSPDLECAAELYWHALKHRVIDPRPQLRRIRPVRDGGTRRR